MTAFFGGLILDLGCIFSRLGYMSGNFTRACVAHLHVSEAA